MFVTRELLVPNKESLSPQGLTASGGHSLGGVADQFSELARALQAAPDLQQTLNAIVSTAVVTVPGADHAGITLVTGNGQVSTPAATSDLVRRIDEVQYETGEGPCLSSVREQVTIRTDDLSMESRWPRFAARAAALGVRSMLAFQLYVRERDLGALNLYSANAGAFTPDDEDTGLLFATHAAIALIGAQHEHHLHRAMVNSDVIGQAKGILMERHKIPADAAFLLMARVSQNSNRPLHIIAAAVAASGLEPDAAATLH